MDDIIVFKNSPKFYPIVITEVTVAFEFYYFGRKRVNLNENTYRGLDNALIKFCIRLPQELRYTSSLLVTNPYGNKTGQTKSESLFAGK